MITITYSLSICFRLFALFYNYPQFKRFISQTQEIVKKSNINLRSLTTGKDIYTVTSDSFHSRKRLTEIRFGCLAEKERLSIITSLSQKVSSANAWFKIYQNKNQLHSSLFSLSTKITQSLEISTLLSLVLISLKSPKNIVILNNSTWTSSKLPIKSIGF